MYIKDQQGERIIKFTEGTTGIFPVGFKKVEYHIRLECQNYYEVWLGTYSTKERAVEVIGEIADCISKKVPIYAMP